jgi:uncharacterized protein YggE
MEITTVAAQGQAEAPFTLASFNLQLVSLGSTVPVAKNYISRAIEELTSTLERLKQELNFDFAKNSVRSSSNVAEKYEYNRTSGAQDSVGYTVTYFFSFGLEDLELVDQVYDALISLDLSKEITFSVQSPAFSLKNRERLNKKALKVAFQKVQDRFETECEVLGLDASSFEIVTWAATYSDTQRSQHVLNAVAARSRAPMGGSAPSISFNAGLANVTVNLEVGYARRITPAVTRNDNIPTPF